MAEQDQLGLHNLPAPPGARSVRKRKGRGPGSGRGKTAGRGENGQRSRSGGGVRPGFEGGQMPLIRRIPKRGFTNPFRSPNQVVNLKDLESLDGAEVTPFTLKEKELVSHSEKPVKILGVGDVSKAYTVSGCATSAAARTKIEKAGGQVES
ncbi:MAG: 50S ribosomal protein L15 [Gemmatimonadetes bacterium]|nr:50S ribosomal protein L15 [Gemmatimonadota bacterium]